MLSFVESKKLKVQNSNPKKAKKAGDDDDEQFDSESDDDGGAKKKKNNSDFDPYLNRVKVSGSGVDLGVFLLIAI